jgi:hypothetical protein
MRGFEGIILGLNISLQELLSNSNPTKITLLY